LDSGGQFGQVAGFAAGAGLDQHDAWVQAAGGGGDVAEGEAAARGDQVLDVLVWGVFADHDRGLVLRGAGLLVHLGDQRGDVGLLVGLHVGQPAQVGDVDPLGDQGGDHPGVVGGHEQLDVHVEGVGQMLAEWFVLGLLLLRRDVGDDPHPQARRYLARPAVLAARTRPGEQDRACGHDRQSCHLPSFAHPRSLLQLAESHVRPGPAARTLR